MIKSANVAHIILQQIKIMDKWALASWGAKDFVSSEKSGEVMKNSESKDTERVGPYLKFSVNGSKLKGFVIITLNNSDEYDCLFYKMRGMKFSMVKRVNGIGVENLLETLDEEIG